MDVFGADPSKAILKIVAEKTQNFFKKKLHQKAVRKLRRLRMQLEEENASVKINAN